MKAGLRSTRAARATAVEDGTAGSPDASTPGGAAATDAGGCSVHEGLRNLVQLLPRVMRGMRRAPKEPAVIDGVALGPRHGSALSLIREQETTVSALAAALDLNLATVSGVVADLERVGFAERSTDPEDRRRTLVRVKPGSEDLVETWLEGATAPIVRALQKLSPEERRTFVKAMGYLEIELNGARSPFESG